MTIETGIDPIAGFDEAVKLRHLAGALYCVALHAPCTCEGELCHDPNCDECTTAVSNNEVCPRCLSMSKYEACRFCKAEHTRSAFLLTTEYVHGTCMRRSCLQRRAPMSSRAPRCAWTVVFVAQHQLQAQCCVRSCVCDYDCYAPLCLRACHCMRCGLRRP